MQKARVFLDTPNATIEQNQEYIADSNQFTAEGEFTAEELAELFLIRAIIFTRLKDHDNAFESFNAALDSGNLSPILKAEAYKNKGLLHYTTATYELAKDDFISALNILSGNAELHYYLANSLFGLMQFEEAINQYDLALEGMAANRFLAYYGKASVYYQQELYEKSHQNLVKSLAVRTDFEPATSLLAEIEAINGQIGQQTTEQTQSQTPVSNTELTASEIYNQLLQQALAAQKDNDGEKPKSIQLNLDDTKRQVTLSKQNTTKAPAPTTAIRISAIPAQPIAKPGAKPLPELQTTTEPTPEPNGNMQISATPFIIDQSARPQRLNNLLNDGQPVDLEGYFLQLISGSSKQLVQNYYVEMVKKHTLLLAQRPYIIRPFTDSQERLTHQLLISGFESYKQANSLCKFLKAQKSDCFVRQIK